MSSQDDINIDIILKENENNIRRLKENLSTPFGVIPFFGAGLSKQYGFPLWTDFLLMQAPDSIKEKVQKRISAGEYEEAAEDIENAIAKHAFNAAIEDAFGDHVIDSVKLDGTISLLPQLALGPVITTNFDHSLEKAFMNAGCRFENIVCGAKVDLVTTALRQNKSFLLKIHGDVSDRTDRIITRSDYMNKYSDLYPISLFTWEDIPGNDRDKVRHFLISNYHLGWIKRAKIKEMEDGNTILITTEKDSLSLNLNNENTELSLKIDNGKTDKFIVKTENGKRNIYPNTHDQNSILPNILSQIMISRTILFMGCSLNKDRTVEITGNVAKKYPGIYHFAIVEKPESNEAISYRGRFLSEHGIHPIWYPTGQHDSIKLILSFLIEQIPSEFRHQRTKKEMKSTESGSIPTKNYINSIGMEFVLIQPGEFDMGSKDKYFFCWEEIPGNDNRRLIEFLMQKFEIEWVDEVEIEKKDDGKNIGVTIDKKYILLTLNDEKTIVSLEIDDDSTYEFKVKTENDKLKIYDS